MKKYLLVIAFIAGLIPACRELNREKDSFLSTAKLEKQFFAINPLRDTIISAKSGTVIRIPAYALKAETTEHSVQLEVREALTLADMLQAGLMTNASGIPLSSGGMLYLNAEPGVSLQKELEVLLPSSQISSQMELYQGSVDTNGKVDWVNPKPLPVNPQISAFENGRQIFQQTCSPCHQLGKTTEAGPDLAHFQRRFPLEQDNHFIYYTHYSNVLPDSDAGSIWVASDHLQHWTEWQMEKARIYKCNLQAKFPNSKGPALLTSLGDSYAIGETLNVYRYIQEESNRLRLKMPEQASLFISADSCVMYKLQRWLLDSSRNAVNEQIEQLLNERESLVVDDRKGPTGVPEMQIAIRNGIWEDLVSPMNAGTTYYQFRISSFGWYNIDKIYGNSADLLTGQLQVRTSGDVGNTNVYLIIPSHNVLQQGGTLDDGKTFGFYFRDGALKLPANSVVWLLAMQDSENGPQYALEQINTTSAPFDINVTLSLKTSTAEAFNQQLKTLGWDRLDVTVSQTDNYVALDSLRTTLQNLEDRAAVLEALRPGGCNCNCGAAKDTTTSKL